MSGFEGVRNPGEILVLVNPSLGVVTSQAGAICGGNWKRMEIDISAGTWTVFVWCLEALPACLVTLCILFYFILSGFVVPTRRAP